MFSRGCAVLRRQDRGSTEVVAIVAAVVGIALLAVLAGAAAVLALLPLREVLVPQEIQTLTAVDSVIGSCVVLLGGALVLRFIRA